MTVLHFNDQTPAMGRFVHCEGDAPLYPPDTTFAIRCGACGLVTEYEPPIPSSSPCGCVDSDGDPSSVIEDHHFESAALRDAFVA